MKYIKLFSVLLLTVFMAACNDFLEENPKSLLSPSNFPSSAEDCELILGGMQSVVASQSFADRGLYFLAEVSSDETTVRYTTGDRYELDNMVFTTDNQYIRMTWSSCYTIINQSNILIKYLPDEDWAQPYIGAAKFYRAWMYSTLVRLWGPTIVRLEPTEQISSDEEVVRTSEKEVFDIIVDDLVDAEQKLPELWTGNAASPDDGRPTKGAAKVLLAEMYATMAGWPVNDVSKWKLASDKAKEVMDMGLYHLLPDFADLYLIAKKNGPEHIFSFQHTEPGGTMMSIQSRPRGEGIKKGGWYLWNTQESFMNTFSDEDARKSVTFLTELIQPPYDTIPYSNFLRNPDDPPCPAIGKWQDFGRDNIYDNAKRTALIVPVFRYAEVLLLRAEAENEANGPDAAAYAAFNELRGRSNPNNLLPTGLTQEQFRDSVRKEWSYEFAFEMKRRYNILRWGIIDDVLSNDPHASKGYQPYKKYYPIPQAEFDAGLDPSLQTPGY
ncbi:MAG: RagB/SusD family nutrient uptake outer membrane protein [Chlorobi bacterium]|nr:RagB/SusD family nutrient uptake outer membrane protein [Chlorobiota bacterium]